MTLVLLHGASGNAATWAPVLPSFSATDVWAPDLPGRGLATEQALPTVAQTARWLANTLAERFTSPVPVLGHSYGGAVALQLALDHLERVSAVVMVSSASRLRVHPAILAAVADSTSQAPYRLDAAFGASTATAVIEAYATAASSVPPSTALADWTACDGFDVRHRLQEVACPVLIVHGGADVLTVPKHQARLEETLPDATRITLEGVGHMLPWEAPTQLARAVENWLSEQWTP